MRTPKGNAKFKVSIFLVRVVPHDPRSWKMGRSLLQAGKNPGVRVYLKQKGLLSGICLQVCRDQWVLNLLGNATHHREHLAAAFHLSYISLIYWQMCKISCIETAPVNHTHTETQITKKCKLFQLRSELIETWTKSLLKTFLKLMWPHKLGFFFSAACWGVCPLLTQGCFPKGEI